MIERVLGWGLGVPATLVGLLSVAFALIARDSSRFTAGQLAALAATGALLVVCGVAACRGNRWAIILSAVLFCWHGTEMLCELPRDYLLGPTSIETFWRWASFAVVAVTVAMSLTALAVYLWMARCWSRQRRRARDTGGEG